MPLSPPLPYRGRAESFAAAAVAAALFVHSVQLVLSVTVSSGVRLYGGTAVFTLALTYTHAHAQT